MCRTGEPAGYLVPLDRQRLGDTYLRGRKPNEHRATSMLTARGEAGAHRCGTAYGLTVSIV